MYGKWEEFGHFFMCLISWEPTWNVKNNCIAISMWIKNNTPFFLFDAMSNFFRGLFESSTRHPFVGRPELSYFAQRIIIYKSSGDIVDNPEFIWKSGSKNGLIHSILPFSGRELPASEIVIFLPEQDFARVSRGWYTQCLDVLSPLYFSLIRERNIMQRF